MLKIMKNKAKAIVLLEDLSSNETTHRPPLKPIRSWDPLMPKESNEDRKKIHCRDQYAS